MRFLLAIYFLLCLGAQSYALNFHDAMKAVQEHDKIREIKLKSKVFSESAKEKSSLGDPTLKIAGKNYPVQEFTSKKSPMTGLEIILSQNLPLSRKYETYRQEQESLAEAEDWLALSRIEELRVAVWSYIISIQRLSEEIQILKDNLIWLQNMISVSQNLYSTGQQSQQAILELKIRKSEIKSSLIDKEFELSKNHEAIGYLTNKKSPIDLSSVPWDLLAQRSSSLDTREKYLLSRQKSAELTVKASDQAEIPDLTVSFGYTRRPDVDQFGDFITLAASLPLAFSDKRQANRKKSLLQKQESEVRLRDYLREKSSQLEKFQIEKNKIEAEFTLLESESIVFAENSRQITTASYQLGKASYIELLQSELKLQSIKMKRVEMKAKLLTADLNIKSLTGDKLYE